MNSILISELFSTNEVSQSLLGRRSASLDVKIEKSMDCEFQCGQNKVFFSSYRVLEAKRARTILCERIANVKCVGNRNSIFLLVLMSTPMEPSIDTLSWINIDCGLEHQCSVVFFWTVEEGVQFLESLASVSYPSLFRPRQDTVSTDATASLPVLIEALTQSPQVLTRNDVVRASNRCKSVADLLLCSAETFADIPGFGPKKSKKIHRIFNTSFLTSAITLPDKFAKPKLSDTTRLDEEIPTAVQLALERIQNIEDKEDLESQPKPPSVVIN